MTIHALIPARSGSKRSPGKNIRPLAGHPLLAWSILSAQQSGLFTRIAVSTDSLDYADIAQRYGAEAIIRPPDAATDDSADIFWVRHALANLPHCEAFAILRPTSPFRTADTIQRAWAQFSAFRSADSIRAVEPSKQHPGKQWTLQPNQLISPVWPREWTDGVNVIPFHSRPTQTLPPVLAQNASLEIAWRRVVPKSISGVRVLPFYTQGYEGLDINRDEDFLLAETLLEHGLVRLEAPDDWTTGLSGGTPADGGELGSGEAVAAPRVREGAVDGQVRRGRPRTVR